eukprot:scaffold150812_cov27-Tisochrysis_lutea.AAC.4
MGIAIVSNIFMEAIERITSKKLTRRKKGGAPNELESVLVWNPTVANLTLLALGSSAPEIILAVLEILLNRFEAGELGPGTIVGSAAFNMLMIIAVCIVAIPSPQVGVRKGKTGRGEAGVGAGVRVRAHMRGGEGARALAREGVGV